MRKTAVEARLFVTEMEVKLQLSVFVLLIQACLAVLQRVTVIQGHTLTLSCPLTNAHMTSVDWRNPQGYIMFFNHNQALMDKRYSINKLSQSEFTISISNVNFKDGGNYTCTQYDAHTTEKKVEVTVLGRPIMEVAKHEGKFVIKCTAEGNHHPPQIFWRFNHGPEILAHAQVLHEDKKYVSMGLLPIHSVESRVTVKCIVRHPALPSRPLMNFVIIGQRGSTKSRRTTTTSSPTTCPQGSTEPPAATTGRFTPGTTTVYLATTDVNGPSSSESSIKLLTVPSNQLFTSDEPNMVTAASGLPLDPVTSTDSHLSTSNWTSVSETTEEVTSNVTAEGNRTGSFDGPKLRTGSEGSSSLLVFLVTCLIFGLLVVVIFLAIKLRRAHVTWKRENEETDPSEESSKSKSSQEESNSQGQRRRGLFNTAFTQYVVEKPTVINSVINTAATESVHTEETSQHTSAKCDIKETEL